MASLTVDVPVRIDTRLARVVIRVLSFVAPVIGTARASHLAERAAYRLTRVRIGSGRWRWGF